MTKQVTVKNVAIGGGAPVSIQSMCNVPFDRFDELCKQVKDLEDAGCEIVRVSVPDKESAYRLGDLKEKTSLPLVADIHYDWKLAVLAVEAGADKIRINPGNMDFSHLADIANTARAHNIPIRVGINAGSLEKDLLAKYGAPTPRALAESAARNVALLEQNDFEDIVVSIKTSNVRNTVEAYRLYQNELNPAAYPLHVGVTEAGTLRTGTIKSAIGIGALLLDGIGDTIRVSLSANPVEEVHTAKTLLRSLGLRKSGLEIVSCPTCGRTTVDSISLANRIETAFSHISFPVRIAVMGCVVNGIGESAEADFGVTGTNGKYVLFKQGTIVKDIPEEAVFDVIRREIEILEKERT